MPSLSSVSLPGRARRRYLATLAILPLAGACQSDHLTRAEPVEPSMLYWALELNHHAVTLSTTAPYDTLTLTATPKNPAGEPLAGLPAPTFRSTNTDAVVVTADGVLLATKPTGDPVAVIATLVADNLEHIDTVLVRVVANATPPVMQTFSIHPVPPDSAKSAMTDRLFSRMWYLLNHLVRATDTNGAAFPVTSVGFDPNDFFPVPTDVTDLLVSFSSSDTTVAKIDHTETQNGVRLYKLSGQHQGTAWITATATVFGVTMSDSILFRVGLPLLGLNGIADHQSDGSPLIGPDGYPQIVVGNYNTVVGTGAMVIFDMSSGADITFEDPTNVAAAEVASNTWFSVACFFVVSCTDTGNIPAAAPANNILHGRTFPVPGVYVYHSTMSGFHTPTITATITVVDESP